VLNPAKKLSIIKQTKPNSFLESLEMSKKDGVYNLKFHISSRDFYEVDTKRTSWINDPEVSKYYFIKIVCVTDEKLYYDINKNNYFDLLEVNKQNTKTVTLNINNFLGDKNNLENFIESSSLQEIIYKFNYLVDFDVKESSFIGFVIYSFFDSDQYSKDTGVKASNKKNDNRGFVPQKYLFFANNEIKKIVTRVYTSTDDPWLSDYIETEQKIFFKIKDKTYNLKRVDEELKIIDRGQVVDVLTVEKPTNYVWKKWSPAKKQLYSSVSSAGWSIDNEANLHFYMAFDALGTCLKESPLYSKLGKKIFTDESLNEIKNKTLIKDIYVERTENHSSRIKKFHVFELDSLHYTNNAQDSSLSKVFMLHFKDEDIRKRPNGKYSYRLFAVIEDGYKLYFEKYIKTLEFEYDNLNNYLNYCFSVCKKKNSFGKNENYDFLTDKFTDKFIEEQSKEDSYWNRCQNAFSVYHTFYNLISEEKLSKTPEQILESLSPLRSSITSIEIFLEYFKKLVNRVYDFSKTQKNNIVRYETQVIENFDSYNGTSYYNYFKEKENFSYDDLRINSIDSNSSFLFPKKVLKINSVTSKDFIYSSDLMQSPSEFKISDNAISLIFDQIKKRDTLLLKNLNHL